MSKYESAKTLKRTKARLPRSCDVCGAQIKKGAEYFRESLGLMAKPPGLYLRSFCLTCKSPKAEL
jgi:hypothetical protein